METHASGTPGPAPGAPPPATRNPSWYERGWARGVSLALIVVGLVLAGLGVAGFMAAADTNDQAAETRDQAADLQARADELARQRDDALTAATAATERADELAADTTALTEAILSVRDNTNDSVDAGNVVTDCSSLPSDDAFISCTRDALPPWETALQTQRDGITALREETTALEEVLG